MGFIANEPQWPPRSPLAALKSTPGGRDRLRQLAERRSPSPSKRRSPTKQLDAYSSFDGAMDVDGDEDEDEETLQLRLAEIQAKLRLKKLQKAKEAAGGSQDAPAPAPPLIRSSTTPNLRRANSQATARNAEIAGLREERLDRNRSQVTAQVPVSPIKRAPLPDVNRSPSRVLLGIDKGLKGADVSLRPAPVARKSQNNLMDDVRRAGNYLHRSGSSLASNDPIVVAPSAVPTQQRPATSFSERMAQARHEEVAQRQRAERLKQVRSKGFDIDRKEMEALKNATHIPLPASTGDSFGQGSFSSQTGPALVSRSKSSGHLRTLSKTRADAAALPPPSPTKSQQNPLPPLLRADSATSTPSSVSAGGGDKTTEFDSFSGTHLSKRIIPHTTLTRTLKGKKTYKIPDLLKIVTSQNNFQLPECEEDIVVFAILANKSEPKTQKNGANPGSKFMILTMCDLKWELDLYLFGSGFERFWKLTPGHVLAILNPTVMKPFKADTGRFSLVINSDDDTILEIGSARDLFYCKTIKKDGSQCDAWVDKRHTEYCEYHINEAVRKTKASRMEVNTMDFGKGRTHGAEKFEFRSKDVTGYQDRAARKRKEVLERQGGKTYNWQAGGNIYMHKGQAHFDNEVGEQIAKKERTQKRFAAEEKERELARELSKIGGGLGAEYMAKKANGNERPPPLERDLFWNPPPPPDARKLGLLDGKASEVSLAPAKRKRTGTSSSNGGANSARGWGGELSKDLNRMREGQRLEPVKKKTRFVTAKGIREAGRESFGGEVIGVQKMVELDDDDDDDDLDIIR